jgi:hypothetical protein
MDIRRGAARRASDVTLPNIVVQASSPALRRVGQRPAPQELTKLFLPSALVDGAQRTWSFLTFTVCST